MVISELSGCQKGHLLTIANEPCHLLTCHERKRCHHVLQPEDLGWILRRLIILLRYLLQDECLVLVVSLEKSVLYLKMECLLLLAMRILGLISKPD